jgi:predicted aldo/keto reductase-like oxidoreductase
MSRPTRREFLKTTAGAAGALAAGGALSPARASAPSATDWVQLGNSGVQVTRLAFGTGTFGGRIQRELGQERFTTLVRHAYDRGIRFFESADAYDGMHEMLAEALKGVPRDSYKLMTKFRLREPANPRATIDRLRRELSTDYFDILLLHCVRTPAWPEEFKPLRDAFSEVKQKKIILAHGASCHGLLPLRAFPGASWLDVALLRINHAGAVMDNLRDSNEKGDVAEVTSHLHKIHAQGTGIIGMKIMGEGSFRKPEERDASIRFVLKLGVVDAMTIGYKTTAEIDEAIERINAHRNARAA